MANLISKTLDRMITVEMNGSSWVGVDKVLAEVSSIKAVTHIVRMMRGVARRSMENRRPASYDGRAGTNSFSLRTEVISSTEGAGCHGLVPKARVSSSGSSSFSI